MPYTKAQLVVFANERALQLGLPPVTESVFESWIDGFLFRGAEAHGKKRAINPTWTYPDDVKDTVELIVELKSQGAARTSQLLICLCAYGRGVPFCEVKAALKSELRRIVQQQARGRPWWQTHYDDLPNISELERAGRIDQLPLLDPDLAATPFALSKKSSLIAHLRAYWGAEAGDFNILHSLPEEILRITKLFDELGVAPWNIAGAIGPPGESAIDGYEVIDKISESDLESARELFTLMFGGLCLFDAMSDLCPEFAKSEIGIAYRKAAASFGRPEWIVATMALLAIAAFNTRQPVNIQPADSQGKSPRV